MQGTNSKNEFRRKHNISRKCSLNKTTHLWAGRPRWNQDYEWPRAHYHCYLHTNIVQWLGGIAGVWSFHHLYTQARTRHKHFLRARITRVYDPIDTLLVPVWEHLQRITTRTRMRPQKSNFHSFVQFHSMEMFSVVWKYSRKTLVLFPGNFLEIKRPYSWRGPVLPVSLLPPKVNLTKTRRALKFLIITGNLKVRPFKWKLSMSTF